MNIIEVIRKLEKDQIYEKYHMSEDNILAISMVNIKREKTIGSNEVIMTNGCIIRSSESIVIIYDIDNDFGSHAVIPNNHYYIKSLFENVNLDFRTDHVNDQTKELYIDDILSELEEKENG